MHAVYSHWYHLDTAGVSCILYAANLLLGEATGCGHQNPSKTDIVHWSTPHTWRVQFGSATNKNRKSNAFMSAVQIIKKRKLPARSLLMNKAVPQKIHSLTIRLLGYPGIPRLCPPLLFDRMTRHFVIITPFYSIAPILQSLSFT